MKQMIMAALALSLTTGTWRMRADAAAAGDPAPVLVELFTSEGCSSCPPADRLLRQLNGTRSRAGARIIGLSEHVTYWDHLGWKDRFSDGAVTARQSAYGDHFHLDSIYTPQVVVNGRVQLVGSDAAGLRKAIDSQPPAMEARLHIADVRWGSDGISARVQFQGVAKANGVLFAVIAQDMASTAVQHGENSGETLTHVSIARTLSRIGTVAAADETIVHLSNEELRSTDGQKRHLVIFAQSGDAGPVLAVDTVVL